MPHTPRRPATTQPVAPQKPTSYAATARRAVTYAAVLLLAACTTGAPPPQPPPSLSSQPLPALSAAVPPPRSPLVRITGRIDDIDGAWWTLTGDDGQQHTIGTSTLTRFGTTTQRMPRTRFKVGTRALIIGWPAGDTITAARISPPDSSMSRGSR